MKKRLLYSILWLCLSIFTFWFLWWIFVNAAWWNWNGTDPALSDGYDWWWGGWWWESWWWGGWWWESWWWESSDWGDGQTGNPVENDWNSSNNTSSNSRDVWIDLSDECLRKGWRWCFKLDYLFWWKNSQIAQRNDNRTVIDVLQDAVLAATYMVWTVLTIVLIYCWLMYIIASWSWKEPTTYKKWLIYAAIWAVLVRSAYAIVRLIQYIAKW